MGPFLLSCVLGCFDRLLLGRSIDALDFKLRPTLGSASELAAGASQPIKRPAVLKTLRAFFWPTGCLLRHLAVKSGFPMRASPSIVPGIDRDVYLVLDDFGLGCDWRETNVEDTDLEAVLNDLLEGQYNLRRLGSRRVRGRRAKAAPALRR